MIFPISYSSAPYYENLQNRLIAECNKFELSGHTAYTQRWLRNTQFYGDHKDLLDAQRGAGFWAWKPYIIKNTLSAIAENDIVLYLDASTRINVDPRVVIQSVKDILVCDSSWVNHDWIKRDAFVYMGCDSELYWNATQVWAGVVIVRKTEVAEEFVNDWLLACIDRRIISTDPNVCGLPNLPGYQAHREDQAALTLLVTKYIHEYEMLGVETRPTMPFVDE